MASHSSMHRSPAAPPTLSPAARQPSHAPHPAADEGLSPQTATLSKCCTHITSKQHQQQPQRPQQHHCHVHGKLATCLPPQASARAPTLQAGYFFRAAFLAAAAAAALVNTAATGGLAAAAPPAAAAWLLLPAACSRLMAATCSTPGGSSVSTMP